MDKHASETCVVEPERKKDAGKCHGRIPRSRNATGRSRAFVCPNVVTAGFANIGQFRYLREG